MPNDRSVVVATFPDFWAKLPGKKKGAEGSPCCFDAGFRFLGENVARKLLPDDRPVVFAMFSDFWAKLPKNCCRLIAPSF